LTRREVRSIETTAELPTIAIATDILSLKTVEDIAAYRRMSAMAGIKSRDIHMENIEKYNST
jgi:hypothetical protein